MAAFFGAIPGKPVDVLGNGKGGQHADKGDDDHQFHQRETRIFPHDASPVVIRTVIIQELCQVKLIPGRGGPPDREVWKRQRGITAQVAVIVCYSNVLQCVLSTA